MKRLDVEQDRKLAEELELATSIIRAPLNKKMPQGLCELIIIKQRDGL